MRAFGKRVAMNAPIQGTAADMIKIAMVRVHELLKGRRTRLIMQIHDELLFDVPKSELDIVTPLIKEIMESVIPLAVPLPVAISSAKDWLSAH